MKESKDRGNNIAPTKETNEMYLLNNNRISNNNNIVENRRGTHYT